MQQTCFYLQEAGVPTPKFGLAKSAAEAKKIAEDIAGNDLVSCVTEYLVMLTLAGDLNKNNLMSDLTWILKCVSTFLKGKPVDLVGTITILFGMLLLTFPLDVD